MVLGMGGALAANVEKLLEAVEPEWVMLVVDIAELEILDIMAMNGDGDGDGDERCRW